MDTSHRTERGFDRVVNFSDAVVAIAITLLVLPLMDLQTDSASDGTWELLTSEKTSPVFISFAITFLVTAIMWLAHHRVFEYVADYDQQLVWLNFLWLLMIVLLPFMSSELTRSTAAPGTVAAYCLVMAGLSLFLGLIVAHIKRHPQLMADSAKPSDIGGSRSWAFAGYLSLLALLALWYPGTAQWMLIGLFFVGRFAGYWDGLVAKRRSS